MWFGLFTMTAVVGVGVWTREWMVVFGGLFSLGVMFFARRAIVLPMKWLEKRGIPEDFYFELTQLRRREGGLGAIQRPKAALVAERIGRSDSFIRVVRLSQTPSGHFQPADVRPVFEDALFWVDAGEYDLTAVAQLGVSYFDTVVVTAQKHILFKVVGDDIRQYAELLGEGVEEPDISAYMRVLGASEALPFLQAGIPLEFARVVEGETRD